MNPNSVVERTMSQYHRKALHAVPRPIVFKCDGGRPSIDSEAEPACLTLNN